MQRALGEAARAIEGADAILVGAGAGMGVDSGLPDFRGNEGFWRAYPPFARLGLSFAELASPRWFTEDPALAWGFYGHRLELYRRVVPHRGFGVLRGWGEQKAGGCFVFTSNVDGHFQVAGFAPEVVVEAHGSIHWLQCLRECGVGVFPAAGQGVEVDEATMRAVGPLPCCPGCGGLARPSILMFGDWGWDSTVTAGQEARFEAWCREVRERGSRLAVIEFGAGGAVPTVRATCERLAQRLGGALIRVNPREPAVPAGGISLPMGALEALGGIAERLA